MGLPVCGRVLKHPHLPEGRSHVGTNNVNKSLACRDQFFYLCEHMHELLLVVGRVDESRVSVRSR